MNAVPEREHILDALRQVIDPEAGIDIVALGLVYGVDCRSDAVCITLTMTSPACPLGEMICDEAHAAVAPLLAAAQTLDVQLVWEPPWGPERMSETARAHFGWEDGDGR